MFKLPRRGGPVRSRPCLSGHFKAPGEDYIQNWILAVGLDQMAGQGQLPFNDNSHLRIFARRADPKIPTRCESEARLMTACKRYFKANPKPVPVRSPNEPACSNLTLVGDILSLEPSERTVLSFMATLCEDSAFHSFAACAGTYAMAQAHTLVAYATGLTEMEVRRALSPKGRLLSSGLVVVNECSSSLDDRFSIKRGLGDLLSLPDLTRAAFVQHFLPEAKPTELVASDFSHMQNEVATARALLGAAVKRAQPGVNVLFFGPTGTGKSALASLLAAELKVRLHTAGTADAEGDAATPMERLGSLLLGQRLFGGGQGLLLFDELEDLFQSDFPSMFGGMRRQRGVMSKVWFNLLLEDNPAPTIWISNSVDGVDPAFLRRFAYVVEFKPAGPRERERVLARHAADTDLSAEDISQIARRYDTNPAQIATAVSAARLIAASGRPDRAALEQVMSPMERLLNGGVSPHREDFDAAAFRLDGVKAKADLTVLADRLAAWKEGNCVGVSLCLYGPPGTGKTEFARYLAFRAGRPIVYRRASDLISKWVGESEKLIAAAFRAAETEGAVLVFDEVDTFLRDREKAHAGWEVTQVNEFLQQLEAFKGMVVCTTNLLHGMDPAAMRRFVFKVEFSYAGASQAGVLFDSLLAGFLAHPLTETDRAQLAREFGRMPSLAAGDFAAVARRTRALGGLATMGELLAALAEEVAVKRAPRAASGFV